MRLRDYPAQCVLCPVSLPPPVLSLRLGIRVNAGSLGGRHGHQHLDITERGVIVGKVVIIGVIIVMGVIMVVIMVITAILGMIVGIVEILVVINVIIGKVVILGMGSSWW